MGGTPDGEVVRDAGVYRRHLWTGGVWAETVSSYITSRSVDRRSFIQLSLHRCSRDSKLRTASLNGRKAERIIPSAEAARTLLAKRGAYEKDAAGK